MQLIQISTVYQQKSKTKKNTQNELYSNICLLFNEKNIQFFQEGSIANNFCRFFRFVSFQFNVDNTLARENNGMEENPNTFSINDGMQKIKEKLRNKIKTKGNLCLN